MFVHSIRTVSNKLNIYPLMVMLISFAAMSVFTINLHAQEKTALDWIIEGRDMLNNSNVEQAIVCFETAVAMTPRYGPGIVYLGKAYMKSGSLFSPKRYVSAKDYFEKAIKLLPDGDRFKIEAIELLKGLPDLEPVQCQHCPVLTYVAKKTLAEHNKAVHWTQCIYCTAGSDSGFYTFELAAHINKMHTCNYCRIILKESELKVHLNDVHKCKYCEQSFRTEIDRKDHVQANHFPCPYCDTVYKLKNGLERHILTVHTFTCKGCLEVFHTQALFDTHIQAGHKFTCKYCLLSNEFSTEKELNQHLTAAHILCKYCGQGFTEEKKRDDHEMIIYRCQYCPLDRPGIFHTSTELTNHWSSHKISCTFKGCSVFFYRQAEMDEHVKTTHTFPCKYKDCEFVGSSDAERKQHIKEVHPT